LHISAVIDEFLQKFEENGIKNIDRQQWNLLIMGSKPIPSQAFGNAFSEQSRLLSPTTRASSVITAQSVDDVGINSSKTDLEVPKARSHGNAPSFFIYPTVP
jgi:hypothetical protein